MRVYANDNLEVVKMHTNDGVRYGVKLIGAKGVDYISAALNKAIEQADYYNAFISTLPLTITSDI